MRWLMWKLWAGASLAVLVSALIAIVAWKREPAAMTGAQPSAQAPAGIGGAPAPARSSPAAAQTGSTTAAAAIGATTNTGGYALTEGPRYRPAIAEGGLGQSGYQIFDQAAVGDVNGDGRDDVVVATKDNSVQVFLQQPQGGLAATPLVWRYPHDGRLRPMKLVLADLNGDGAMDIVTLREKPVPDGPAAGLNILLSDGLGGLSLHQTFGDTGGAMDGWSAMDVDQDGLQDVIGIVQRPGAPGECVSQFGSPICKRLRIMYSDGNGGIRDIAYLPLNRPGGEVVAVLDFDGDGRSDLIHSDAETSFGVRRLLWRRQLPQGGLGEAVAIGSWSGWPSVSAVMGDFNGDGRVDVATAGRNPGTSTLSVQLADGSFAPAQPYPSHSVTSKALAADFDGDGRVDLVSVQKAPGLPDGFAALAYQLQGGGSLGAPQWNGSSHGLTQMLGSGNELASGDFNGDGCRDVAVAVDYEGVAFYYGSGCAPPAMSDCDYRSEQTALLPASASASAPAPAPASASGSASASAMNGAAANLSAAQVTTPPAALPPARAKAARSWTSYPDRNRLRSPIRSQHSYEGYAQARGRVTSRPKRMITAPVRTHWRTLRRFSKS